MVVQSPLGADSFVSCCSQDVVVQSPLGADSFVSCCSRDVVVQSPLGADSFVSCCSRDVVVQSPLGADSSADKQNVTILSIWGHRFFIVSKISPSTCYGM